MPDALATLLAALHADPADVTAWLALADALEEDGQPLRAELVRLSRSLGVKRDQQRKQREGRLRELLAGGVEPCVPAVTNSIGMKLALIPAGTFLMGSPAKEPRRFEDEGPRHEVRISRPFYLGVFTVTQGEYRAVMGTNPSYFGRVPGAKRRRRINADRLPVERVDWSDCVAFCQHLSEQSKEKAAGRVYRLPSEAEWEYACRAGTTTATHFGDRLSSSQANFDGNHPYAGGEKGGYLMHPTEVGSYRPNAFGLYDVHGNVWEWCHDWYDSGTYRESPRIDPRGPATGSYHLLRGGSWKNEGFYLRSSHRGWSTADERIGFRVAMEWHSEAVG